MVHFPGPVRCKADLDAAAFQVFILTEFPRSLAVVEQALHGYSPHRELGKSLRKFFRRKGKRHQPDAFFCIGKFVEQQLPDAVRWRKCDFDRHGSADQHFPAECFLVCASAEFAGPVFLKLALVAGGDLRRFQNQRIVVVFPGSVDREIERACPDVFGVDDDEFVVHDRRTVVGDDGNARFFELFHGGKHDVVFIGDDADFHSALFRFRQSARDFVEIQIVNTDVDRAFCGTDEVAEPFADIGRRSEIEFDGFGIRNRNKRGVIVTGTVGQEFGDDRIAGAERERVHRFERFGNPFFRKIRESRAKGTEKQGNAGYPAAHGTVRRFPGRLGLCLADGFFCGFSAAHTILGKAIRKYIGGKAKSQGEIVEF